MSTLTLEAPKPRRTISETTQSLSSLPISASIRLSEVIGSGIEGDGKAAKVANLGLAAVSYYLATRYQMPINRQADRK